MGTTFVCKWGRERSTLQCLLPGEWLTGDTINFFIAKRQPPPTDGIVICSTYFWSGRLENTLQKPKDVGISEEGWDEKAWKRVFEYRLGISESEPVC